MSGKWWYVVFGVSEDGHSVLNVGKYDAYYGAYAYCESCGWKVYCCGEWFTLQIKDVCEPGFAIPGGSWLDDVKRVPIV